MRKLLAVLFIFGLGAPSLRGGPPPNRLMTKPDNEIICFAGDMLAEASARAQRMKLRDKQLVLLRGLKDVTALILEINRKDGHVTEIVFHTVSRKTMIPQPYRSIRKGDEDFDIIVDSLKRHFGVSNKSPSRGADQ
jgi:hypothetical protein